MRPLRFTLCAALLLALAVPTSGHAFNGLRRGFVLGGGLGIAPSVTWKADGGIFGDQEETKLGAAGNFMIGYGWNEQNLLVFESNGASISSDKINDAMLSQGFGGAAWYHYFKPSAPTPFTIAGIGFYSFFYDIEDGEEDSNDSGLGLLGGGGWEFSRHWQVYVVLHGGQSSNHSIDFSHLTISALIGGVAF